jgi:glycosyltransferase involved in cell wall biosynthesis
LPPRVRVLHLIDSLRLGGAQRLLADIVRHADTGAYESTICVLQGGEAFREEFLGLDAELHILECPRLSLAPVRHLRRLCRGGRFDIVHGHLFQGCFWGGWLRHHSHVPRLLAHLHSPLFGPPWSVMEGWATRQADLLIPVSSATMQEFIARYRLSADAMRIIPNGIDTTRFGPGDPGAARQALGVALDTPIIGFVGRLAPVKGVDVLLQALPAVLRELPELRVFVIGDGGDREALQAAAQGLPVQFLGPRADVPLLVPGFDVFCAPSREEPFGIVALEAMACGVPVVASRVGGLVDVVSPEAGVLVPPEEPVALADALVRLLRDPGMRDAMGEAGAAHVRANFDVRSTVRRIEAVYEEMMRA